MKLSQIKKLILDSVAFMAKKKKPNKINDCMIDMICYEAALKTHKRLLRAEVNTIPYAATLVNTLTGIQTGHACLVFHYKGDTWNYDPDIGSSKVFPDIISCDTLAAAKKVYSIYPHFEVKQTIPIDIATMYPEDAKIMGEKIRTGEKKWIGRE